MKLIWKKFGLVFKYAQCNSVLATWIDLTDDSMIMALGDSMGRLNKIISEKAVEICRYFESKF